MSRGVSLWTQLDTQTVIPNCPKLSLKEIQGQMQIGGRLRDQRRFTVIDAVTGGGGGGGGGSCTTTASHNRSMYE